MMHIEVENTYIIHSALNRESACAAFVPYRSRDDGAVGWISRDRKVPTVRRIASCDGTRTAVAA